MKEIWKQIPNYEGYEASNMGNIRSFINNASKIINEPHILKQITNEKGYKRVQIRNKTIRKIWFVHRLVALAFIGDSDLQINHKNGIKKDNTIDNLEYVTQSENLKHSYQIGIRCKKGHNHHMNKLTEKQAIAIKYKEVGLNKDIAKKYNVSASLICLIKKGKSWSHV